MMTRGGYPNDYEGEDSLRLRSGGYSNYYEWIVL